MPPLDTPRLEEDEGENMGEATSCDVRSAGDVRRLLLEVGADLLGGGLPVNEVEDTLRELGIALGEPDVAIAAFPTGLFVTLEAGQSATFRPIGAQLRFEQTADVLELVRRIRADRIPADSALHDLDRIRLAPPKWPVWVSELGLVPIGVGLCVLLQPALPNIIAAAAGSLTVAGLTMLGRLWAPFRPLLPVVAAFVVSIMVFLAADASLLDGPLRTIVAVLAVMLPGSLLITGLSEIAAGSVNAGSARLVSGTVQLALFLTGIVAAAAFVHAPQADLTNTVTAAAPWWVPCLGVAITVAGVILGFNTPLRATPYIVAVVAVTAAVQLSVQSVYGAAIGGLLAAIAAAVAATIANRLPNGPEWQVVYLPAFWVLVPGSFGLINAAQIPVGDALGASLSAGSAIVAVAIGTLIGSLISRVPLAGRRSPTAPPVGQD